MKTHFLHKTLRVLYPVTNPLEDILAKLLKSQEE